MPATLRLTREGFGIELRHGPFEILVNGKSVGSLKYHQTFEGGMVKSCGRRVLIDHAATLVWVSSGRSMSTPFSNLAPARTRATRCGPLT